MANGTATAAVTAAMDARVIRVPWARRLVLAPPVTFALWRLRSVYTLSLSSPPFLQALVHIFARHPATILAGYYFLGCSKLTQFRLGPLWPSIGGELERTANQAVAPPSHTLGGVSRHKADYQGDGVCGHGPCDHWILCIATIHPGG